MIQYSAACRFNLKGRGVLDTPPARGMTVLCKPRRRFQRRPAQKILRFHRLLAGALQFENPDRALLAADREMIVEHFASGTRSPGHRAAQDFYTHFLALDRHLAPRAGKPRH